MRKATPNLKISHPKAINGLNKKMIFWGSKSSNTAPKTGSSFSDTFLADLVGNAVKDGTTCLTQRLFERNGPKKRTSSFWSNTSWSALSGLRYLKWTFWKEDQFHRSKTGSTKTWKTKTYLKLSTKWWGTMTFFLKSAFVMRCITKKIVYKISKKREKWSNQKSCLPSLSQSSNQITWIADQFS